MCNLLLRLAKNEPIEIIEGESQRLFSSQHIELVAQRQDLSLQRKS